MIENYKEKFMLIIVDIMDLFFFNSWKKLCRFCNNSKIFDVTKNKLEMARKNLFINWFWFEIKRETAVKRLQFLKLNVLRQATGIGFVILIQLLFYTLEFEQNNKQTQWKNNDFSVKHSAKITYLFNNQQQQQQKLIITKTRCIWNDIHYDHIWQSFMLNLNIQFMVMHKMKWNWTLTVLNMLQWF